MEWVEEIFSAILYPATHKLLDFIWWSKCPTDTVGSLFSHVLKNPNIWSQMNVVWPGSMLLIMVLFATPNRTNKKQKSMKYWFLDSFPALSTWNTRREIVWLYRLTEILSLFLHSAMVTVAPVDDSIAPSAIPPFCCHVDPNHESDWSESCKWHVHNLFVVLLSLLDTVHAIIEWNL